MWVVDSSSYHILVLGAGAWLTLTHHVSQVLGAWGGCCKYVPVCLKVWWNIKVWNQVTEVWNQHHVHQPPQNQLTAMHAYLGTRWPARMWN
mmetsp:Transcript_10292/g.22078  ORF Transcript_10292/g.22078 Transcript_10292/m.22078 type:complete len:91 (-) Transcript_10292:343-615(-)